MAAVAVTSSGTNTQAGGSRVLVRTSAGVPYVVVDTGNDIDVFKGNSTTPTSFSSQGTGPSNSRYGQCSAAIDSSDIIHIAYYDSNGKSSALRYVTFDTSTDSFSGDVSIQNIGGATPTSQGTSIAIDSNDIPHIAWVDSNSNMGIDYDTIYYTNKVGGSWNTAVEVEGKTIGAPCRKPNICIDSENLPCIAYTGNSGISTGDKAAAIGNSNNATSFTLVEITNDNLAEINGPSIAVDSEGNHHVAYRFGNTTSDYELRIRKHNINDAWTTWQSEETIDGSFSTTNSVTDQNVSLFIDGTKRYVFVEDSEDNDIVYYTDSSGSWSTQQSLEVGTYKSVFSKWAFWVDNNSSGKRKIIFFQNSGSATSTLNSTTTAFGQSFTGNGGDLKVATFWIGQSGTGTLTAKLYAHSGTFGTSSVPTGSPLSSSNSIDISTLSSTVSPVSFTFPTPYTLVNGTNYVIVLEFSYTSGTVTIYSDTGNPSSGNRSTYFSGSWSANSTTDLRVWLLSDIETIDYTFADETASPDIQWNTLSLGGGSSEGTKTFTADAILKDTDVPKTFTADGLLQLTDQTKSFTADAIINRQGTKSFTADAILFDTDVPKTFTADALLQKQDNTKTFTIDAILSKSYEKSFTTDAILKASYTKTWTADAILKGTLTKTFTADAVLKATNTTKTFSADAILTQSGEKSFTADAIIQDTDVVKSFTADAILKTVDNQKTFSADAILTSGGSKTFTVDAIIKDTDVPKTFTTDAVLKSVDQTKSFTADAILTKSYTKEFTADGVLQQSNTKTLSADAMLLASFTKTFTVDAILQGATGEGTKEFTVDALLQQQNNTKTFTADAMLQNSSTKTFTGDALLQGSFTKTFTVDAVLKDDTNSVTFTVDALLQSTDNTKTFTVDAILQEPATEGTKTFSVDAILTRQGSKTFTVDAQLFGTQSKTFTVDAIIEYTPGKYHFKASPEDALTDTEYYAYLNRPYYT